MTRPLPTSPCLENLKKQCKGVLKAHRHGLADACAVLHQLPRFADATAAEILAAKLALHDVQHAVALDYGFTNWRALKRHVDASTQAVRATAPEEVRLFDEALEREGRVLAVDIGAGCLKLLEIVRNAAGTLCVAGFGAHPLDADKTALDAAALRALLADSGVAPGSSLVCLSPQTAFVRFVHLPEGITDEELRVEERKNSPFAPEEVARAWHLGDSSGRSDAMFVAVHREILDSTLNVLRGAGLDPLLVETGPTASRNAATAVGIGATELELLLDIGSSSTMLLFCVPDRFFLRTMPIGIPALSDNLSTGVERLAAEILRSIQVYRDHVKDELPATLHVTGGGSVIPDMDAELARQIELPVVRFNPFAALDMAPAVDRQQLEAVSHLFTNSVGLISRFMIDAPIATNLLK